jgi:UDP-N-acetylglucosamine--N-acetylmuramyl-(pentapeptide) pyrophosphoryl-undecaprenol N-acetylglucosamine transferase
MFASGGTGGHIYPALAAAEAIDPQISLIFVGSAGLERDLVKESGVAFDSYIDVRGGPIAGVSPVRKLISAVNLILGTGQALLLMERQKPDSILLTGGWSGLPVALAAWIWRVPILIFLPDIEPGSTIRLFQRLARRVALTVPESGAYFPPGKTIVTGYPLRQEILSANRAEAIKHFKLETGCKTLLVFGGSRGARSINRALVDILPDLLAENLQIIHVSGTLDWSEVEAQRPKLANNAHYHAYPYLHHDMGLALAAADLVISRAGASTLAEFPLFGLPSILIPYPHAWRYQKVNADYLTERGAAITMQDERMKTDLLTTIQTLLADSERLAEMKKQATALARPDGAKNVAHELVRLAGGVS